MTVSKHNLYHPRQVSVTHQSNSNFVLIENNVNSLLTLSLFEIKNQKSLCINEIYPKDDVVIFNFLNEYFVVYEKNYKNFNFYNYRLQFEFQITNILKNSSSNIIVRSNKNKIFFLDIDKKKIVILAFKKKLFIEKEFNLKFHYNTINFNLDNNNFFFILDNHLFLQTNMDLVILNQKKIKSLRLISDLLIVDRKIIICDKLNYKLIILDKKFSIKKNLGFKGKKLNLFDLPHSIIKYDRSNILITDLSNDRVIILNIYTLKFRKFISSSFIPGFLRRPIDLSVYNKKIYILDRENLKVQSFDTNLNFINYFNLNKTIKNNKPNSFLFIKNKGFYVLCRNENLTNLVLFYNKNFQLIKKFSLTTKDAQDFTFFNNFFYIPDNLNRRILKLNSKFEVIKSLDLVKITRNERILSKSITHNNECICISDFDNCIIIILDFNLNFIKKISFKKYKKSWVVIRAIKFDKENLLYIFTRSKDSIKIYDLKKNLFKKKLFHNLNFRNPTSMVDYKDNIYIADKENNRVVKVNKH